MNIFVQEPGKWRVTNIGFKSSMLPGRHTASIASKEGRKITHHSSRLGLIGWTGSIQIIKTIHHKMCNTNNVQLPVKLAFSRTCKFLAPRPPPLPSPDHRNDIGLETDAFDASVVTCVRLLEIASGLLCDNCLRVDLIHASVIFWSEYRHHSWQPASPYTSLQDIFWNGTLP
jgi:hypothetical protein